MESISIEMISDEIKKQNDPYTTQSRYTSNKKEIDASSKWLNKALNVWTIKDAIIVIGNSDFNFEHIKDVDNLEFINCHFVDNSLTIIAKYAKSTIMSQPTDYRTNFKFESCKFETILRFSGNFHDVVFYRCSSNNGNNDKKCQFKQKVEILGKYRNLKIEDAEILGKMKISNSEILGTLAITNSTFNQEVLISDDSSFKAFRVFNNDFKAELKINHTTSDEHTEINGNTIKTIEYNKNKIKNGKFKLYNNVVNKCLIKNSVFNKDFNINKCQNTEFCEIIYNTFEGDLNFFNSNIKELIFYISSLGAKKRLNIINDINQVSHIGKLIFDKLPPRTYLENLNIGELDLSRNTVEDKEILSLTNLKINLLKIENFINYGFFTINNFKPIEKSKIEISNSTLGKLDLVSCDLSKVSVQIDNSKLVDIFYTDTVFPNEIESNKEGKAKLEQQRDTYGQLKVVSEKVGNRFQALKFQAKEMSAYYESIKSDEKQNDILEKIYNFFKSIQIWVSNKFWKEERIILFVMKYSNNFRQSWVRGVCFTFVAGLIPFYSMVASFDNIKWCHLCWTETFDIFCYYFGKYFEFINPAHKSDFLEKDNIYGNWTYLWDFLGRIVIGFGIYQTIQAFRKFGKE